MSASNLLLLLALVGLLATGYARPTNLFGWFFPPPEPKPTPHSFKPLNVTEIPAPSAPSGVDWFSNDNKKFHSAILIAGSSGYNNYRHQSDVCHAYRILRERGVDDDNIITFVVDDIAYHSRNPYKGKIFNSPGGRDVYPGCAKDYTGRDVNALNVLAVMTGDAKFVAGKGSGRVLKKDPNQRVFVFYSDHGSVGSLGMPYGGHISARAIRRAFDYMIKNNFFKELVFYLESCESGSIFKGFEYDKNTEILAISASDADESSFATYCPSFFGSESLSSLKPSPAEIQSCMGDLFSVSWMEYADRVDISKKTLDHQIEYATQRTSQNYTYRLGSHVINYSPGSDALKDQVIGNFLSFFNVPSGKTSEDAFKLQEPVSNDGSQTEAEYPSLKQRDADLVYLMQRAMDNDNADDKKDAMEELHDEITSRRMADSQIRSIVEYLISHHALDASIGIEDYVARLLPRDNDLQVVDDWDAYDAFALAWNDFCGEFSDYSRQYTRAFVNLINTGVKLPEFVEATKHVCTAN